MPAIGAAQTQTQSAQLLQDLTTGGASFSSATVQADYGSMYNLLCYTSGLCCFTRYCNAAQILMNNNLLFSFAFIASFLF